MYRKLLKIRILWGLCLLLTVLFCVSAMAEDDPDRIIWKTKSDGSGNVIITGAEIDYGSSSWEGMLEIPSTIKGKKVTAIGDKAFSIENDNNELSGFSGVSIPSSVKKIGKKAFSGLSMKNLVLSEGLKEIGEEAFYRNDELKKVVFPSTLSKLGKGAFALCNNLTSLELPASVKTIPEDAFSECYKVKKVTLSPATLTIGKGAFFCCYDLKSINLPNSIKEIGEDAFYCCYPLNFSVLPSRLKTIGNRAFYNTKITSVTIPAGVKKLPEEAFSACSKLKTVVLPGTISAIAYNTFSETKVKTITYKGTLAKWKKVRKDCISPETPLGNSYNYIGTYSNFWETVNVKCTDGTYKPSTTKASKKMKQLAAPSDLSIKYIKDKNYGVVASLSWKKVTGASRYLIFDKSKGAKKAACVGASSKASFLYDADYDVKEKGKSVIYIQAVDKYGNCGIISKFLTITWPGTPSSLTAKKTSSGKLEITWKAPSKKVDGYDITWLTGVAVCMPKVEGTTTVKTGQPLKATFTLKKDMQYTAEVKAYRMEGKMKVYGVPVRINYPESYYY